MLVLLSDTCRPGRACRFAPTSFTNRLFIPDGVCCLLDSSCHELRLDLQPDRAFARRRGSTLRYHSYHTRPREDHRAWYASTLPHWGIPSSTGPRTSRDSKKRSTYSLAPELAVREKEQPCCCYYTGRRLSFRSALAIMVVHIRIVHCQSETARTKYNHARLCCCSLRIVLSCHRGFLSPNLSSCHTLLCLTFFCHYSATFLIRASSREATIVPSAANASSHYLHSLQERSDCASSDE